MPLRDEEAQIREAYQTRSADSFRAFYKGLILPSAKGPRLYADVEYPFQRECFSAIASSLEQLNRGDLPDIRRFWIERTKKASKDTDIAACLLWLLAFPKRPLYMQVGAADRDQASIVKRRIETYLAYNEWLQDYVKLTTNKAHSLKGNAVLDILAADVGGSHGETPDLLVCNELTHVTKWEFIENLLDNADGVPRGMVIIATNAGFKGTKAEAWRKNALRGEQWDCFIWKNPSPWLSKKDINDARARNSKSRFRRLYEGVWVSGKGDAVDEDLIDSCIKKYDPHEKPQAGLAYVMGIDLGISNDHAGVALLGVDNKRRKITLAQMQDFKVLPTTGEVDLIGIESYIRSINARFHPIWVGYDPFQAKLMAQRLKESGIPMHEMTFTPSNLSLMASTFKQVLTAGTLECFDTEGILRRDFAKFSIVEKSYGIRLEAVRDEYGHADVGTAVVIALPKAVAILEGLSFTQSDVLVYDSDDLKPPTKEELQEMSDEMREIYEAC